MRSLHSFRRSALNAAVSTLILGGSVFPAITFAQAIERNLPPEMLGMHQDILAPNATPLSEDDTPIAAELKGILILGSKDEARTTVAEGVDARLVSRLNTPAGHTLLQKYIGRPVSRKLIAEIESGIATLYRESGFPFVSLSTPPQAIGGGLLQVRVVEFYDGAVKVNGVENAEADKIRSGIRLQPGQAVDAKMLSNDLDWLNRYPFRHVEAVFSPGDNFGRTDLELNVLNSTPWQVYAGYSNSGSEKTGIDRYFIGGQAGGLIGAGSVVSYQFTASDNFFEDSGQFPGETSHPLYISHGARAVMPVAQRQEIEVILNHVETNTTTAPFLARQTTDELSLGYRFSLSNISALPGDISLGFETKRENRKTFFTGVDVLDGAVDVHQLYAGWSVSSVDQSGKSNVNVTLHASPGGGTQGGDAALAAFSNGRVVSSTYQYINAQFNRTTRLSDQWTVSNALIAQYASKPLPDTEQIGIGGADLVRGYTLDDGAYDSAIISHNELRMGAFPFLSGTFKVADQLSPFVFVDAGYAANRAVPNNAHANSVGFGADYQIGTHTSVSLTAAYDLIAASVSKNGEVRFCAKATIMF